MLQDFHFCDIQTLCVWRYPDAMLCMQLRAGQPSNMTRASSKARLLDTTSISVQYMPTPPSKSRNWHRKIDSDFRSSKHWSLRLLQMLWFPNSQMCKILKIRGQYLSQLLILVLRGSSAGGWPGAKHQCASWGALLAGMPNADQIFCVGFKEKCAHNHSPYLQFLSPADEIDAIPLLNSLEPTASSTACGERQEHYSIWCSESTSDWLIATWLAANMSDTPP